MVELEPIQKKTLKLFAKSAIKDRFYWTGGTLLSHLYLHHRQSQDLDFFTDKPFLYNRVNSFVSGLKTALNLHSIEKNKIYDRWDFFLHNEQELRIEFVLYEFPKLKLRKKWQGIYIDSLDDLAVNKTMALFDRNDPKDLIDLYFLLTKAGYKINILLKGVEKKFGLSIDEDSFWSECLKSLKDIKIVEPLLVAKNKEKQKEIIEKAQEYFSSKSVSYLKRVFR